MEFNEPVEGLEISDFNITNGTITYLYEYSRGMEYELEVYSASEGEVTLELVEGAVQDMAGNTNEAVSASYIFDGTPPMVTLNAGVTTTSEAVNTVDVSFSESIQYLAMGYFNITNGSATDLVIVTPNIHYTLEVTAGASGNVIVELPDYSVVDMANNGNMEVSVNWLYEPASSIDRTIPRVNSVFPNPVNGNLHIDLERESLISIINMNGTVLYQQDHVLSEIIDMSGFVPGMYVLQVQNDQKIIQYKLIVE